MAADVLAALPGARPGAGCTSSTTASTPTSTGPTRTPTCSSGSASTWPGRTSRSSAGSPGRRACRTCCAPASRFDPRPAARAARRGRRHPGAQGRDRRRDRRPARRARRGLRGLRDAAARGGPPGAHPRAGVPVPVGLRAARHRQPRGDGVRDRRRGQRRRRHPRGRRWTARPGCSWPTTPTTRPASSAASPRRSTGWPPTRSWPRGSAGPGASAAVTSFAWDAIAAADRRPLPLAALVGRSGPGLPVAAALRRESSGERTRRTEHLTARCRSAGCRYSPLSDTGPVSAGDRRGRLGARRAGSRGTVRPTKGPR